MDGNRVEGEKSLKMIPLFLGQPSNKRVYFIENFMLVRPLKMFF